MAKAAKPWLWITDPWKTLDHRNDTTIRLMQESLKLKIPTYWTDSQSIFWSDHSAWTHAQEVNAIPQNDKNQPIRLGGKKIQDLSDFAKIFYRTDPPVDHHYVHPLQLVELGRGKAELVNPASVLTLTNEKITGSFFEEFSPPTWVGCHSDGLMGFIENEEKVVLKPLHTAQSQGVTLIDSQKQNLEKNFQLLKTETQDFTRPVLLQKYLPGIESGETRVWFVDGKPIAQVLKYPLPGDFRVQIDKGSKIEATELSAKQKSAVKKVGQHLKKIGARMAAVDWIGSMISDFNVTSPGLLVQMEAVAGENLAKKILVF